MKGAHGFYNKYFKRLFDIITAFTILVLFLPVILCITLLLLYTDKTNPFFFQLRPGKNEVIFKLIKFRSMLEIRNESGILLPDNLRMTKLGRWLRTTSLDELPQLINVLKGEMSIVGPRPLLIEYLPLYNDFQRRRHIIKPGITGWAQVNGRNAITWRNKFSLDVWYVENLSLMLDLKIIFLTFIKIFKSEDINSSATETMDKFLGNI
jgi:undecaprenyl phosphate N,N'-diacetylbacillosamine 1-phosphate transferase